MTIALDLGVHRFKSLRRDEVQLVGRACRALHAVLPDSPARRQLMEQVRVPFARCEENLVLMGDAAAEFARLFRVPALALLPGGRLPQADPPARQILASLIEALLPKARHVGEICCLTLPGQSAARDVEFLTRLVRLQGYEPLPLRAGMAVVFAEMVRQSFTGIGLTFGAASCEASLAHRGRELANCSHPRGGDWIDEQLATAAGSRAWDAAGNQYLDTEDVARWKEGLEGSILEPASEQGRMLLDLYRDLIGETLTAARDEFASALASDGRSQPLALVACGGAARVPGFAQLLQQVAREIDWPVPLGAIRVAADSDYTVPRGCLINAELETDAHAPAARKIAA